MPDNPQDDKPLQRRKRTAKYPPKTPQQDYSSLPQKTIKLKPDVTLPPVLKQGAKKTRETKPPPTPAKRPTKVVDDISPQAREIAIAAAAQEGVALNIWLENLIIQSQQVAPDSSPEDRDDMMQSLQEIKQRLQQIENKKGFWSRFWEQFMEPHRRKWSTHDE
jgi:hypothetical protein